MEKLKTLYSSLMKSYLQQGNKKTFPNVGVRRYCKNFIDYWLDVQTVIPNPSPQLYDEDDAQS